jgi:hypothetical protein
LVIKSFCDIDKISATGFGVAGRPVNKDQVKLCEVWIDSYLTPTTTKISHELGDSYRIKHVVENWAQALNDIGISLIDENGNAIKNAGYVTNGALITAMRNKNILYRGKDLNLEFAVKYTGTKIKIDYVNKVPYAKEEWLQVIAPFQDRIYKQVI